MKHYNFNTKLIYKLMHSNRSIFSKIIIFRHISWLASLLLLTACSSSLSTQNLELQLQKDHVMFELMPVPSNLQNRLWLDKFIISFDGAAKKISPQNMLLQTELTENSISIAAISFEGIPLAQANWNAKTQKMVSENSLNKRFNPKQVMQDIQSANWSLPLLKSALRKGFTVTEEITESVKIRRFYYQNKLILEITNQANTISFNQIEQGYQIRIIRLEDKPLINSVTANFKY